MNFTDPFPGYSVVLRVIVYGLVPAFVVFQHFRARRALHVFQLEGYKRGRFLDWCRANADRRLFLREQGEAKKPLVMTGRAWRILVTTLVLTALLILLPSAAAHLAGGAPWDLLTCAAMFALAFFGLPRLVVAADVVMAPVQKAINNGYLRSARGKLDSVQPLIVGITGSFGKTSTKFAVAGLLGDAAAVLATPGSFNTPLGVCRTVNEQLSDHHRYFVVEMGAYQVGDIAELCRFVHPKIGVLTAIGPAHLERFGSMENIRRGKYELIESLPADGTAVMNVDDLTVRELADTTQHVKVIRYGLDPAGTPDITASQVETRPDGTHMTIHTHNGAAEVRTRLLGRHAIGHVLAGVAVAMAAGRALDELPAAIASLEAVEHRLQIIEGTGGVTVIDDAYNSNPEGAAAALEVLEAMPARKRIVVTPGIIELGPLQEEENERFGARAAEVADTIVVVAKVNREAIVRGARSRDAAHVVTVDTLEEGTRALQELLAPGDVVLFENDLPDQYE